VIGSDTAREDLAAARELNRAKVLFQMRGLLAAMGIDPDSVRVLTGDNSVCATIDTESDPGSYTDALASPSCFITQLSGASETCPHTSDTAGGAFTDASRPLFHPPIETGQIAPFHLGGCNGG
jgi:hypothetical protein